MRPIAQQIITDINEGKCIKEVGLRGVVESRLLKAGSGWHQAETAEDPQNMNNFAAGSLGGP